MTPWTRGRGWLVLLLGILWVAQFELRVRGGETEDLRPPEGIRRHPPQVHALVGARVVVAPDEVHESATVLIRGQFIESVGADVVVPANARRWDFAGKTIYPGLIDAYHTVEVGVSQDVHALAHWNPHVRPERSAATYAYDVAANRKMLQQGVTLRLVVPKQGVVAGQSVFVALGHGVADSDRVLRKQVALHVRLTAPHGASRKQYPNSPMGAVALARQTFYDAMWHRDAWRVFRTQSGLKPPSQNMALDAMEPFIDGRGLVVIEAPDEQYLQRAERFAREFGLRVAFMGSGHEYRRLDIAQDAGRMIVVPLDFPQAPDVSTVESAAEVTLERLMHWDLAPENPANLVKAGIPIAFASHGLQQTDDFLNHIRICVQRGLPADAALRALTTTPARELGVDHLVGSISPGKLAHFAIADGDLLDANTKVVSTWVDGQPVVDADLDITIRGVWQLVSSESRVPLPALVIDRRPELQARWQTPDPQQNEGAPYELQQVRLDQHQFSAHSPSHIWGISGSGTVRLSAAVVPADTDGDWKLIGQAVLPNGESVAFEGDRVERNPPADGQENAVLNGADVDGETKTEPASFAVNYPLGAFGRKLPPRQPAAVLFQQGTVWTCDNLEVSVADVMVRKGRIEQVAPRIEYDSESTHVVDCRGRHVTPGLVDCHSHIATDGGVNEATQAITAEVRIGDFIDARDVAIYRQLSGGTTTINVLHGSANPIGGQNQVIKLRWGLDPQSLKFAEAPPGIKFALGENVKQSNWGDQFRTRYPQTRMGVEQIVRDAFLAARDYHRRQTEWQSTRKGMPPRRDLEMDALVEVLQGTRWIHCHSYRQDEILALLRTLESFHVQIGTLQHVLEGYKVADAIQRHGATASAFSDWWAYKIEVYDAIPFNGAMMHNQGVVVSFNSDDAELGRHLNHEAAKAVKYGNLHPVEALRFVTLNPAKQLRIGDFVGSITPGKHADIVVWNGPPLSNLSRCEQTWIDGRKYFDIAEDHAQRAQWNHMRTVLIQKILDAKVPMQKAADEPLEQRDLWPRIDEYCRARQK